jgi:hypothetical protein
MLRRDLEKMRETLEVYRFDYFIALHPAQEYFFYVETSP